MSNCFNNLTRAKRDRRWLGMSIGQVFIKHIILIEEYESEFRDYVANIVVENKLSGYHLKVFVDARQNQNDTTAFITFRNNRDNETFIQLVDAMEWGGNGERKRLTARVNGFTDSETNPGDLSSIRYNGMRGEIKRFNESLDEEPTQRLDERRLDIPNLMDVGGRYFQFNPMPLDPQQLQRRLERFNVPRKNNGRVEEEGDQSIKDEKHRKVTALTPSSSFEERPAKREKVEHSDTESTTSEAPSTLTIDMAENQTSITTTSPTTSSTTSSTTTATAPTATGANKGVWDRMFRWLNELKKK